MKIVTECCGITCNHVRLSEGLESIFKVEDLQKETHFRNGTEDIQYKQKKCQIR